MMRRLGTQYPQRGQRATENLLLTGLRCFLLGPIAVSTPVLSRHLPHLASQATDCLFPNISNAFALLMPFASY